MAYNVTPLTNLLAHFLSLTSQWEVFRLAAELVRNENPSDEFFFIADGRNLMKLFQALDNQWRTHIVEKEGDESEVYGRNLGKFMARLNESNGWDMNDDSLTVDALDVLGIMTTYMEMNSTN